MIHETDEYGALKGPFQGKALMSDGSVRSFTFAEFDVYMKSLRVPEPSHGPQGPQGWYPTPERPLPVRKLPVDALTEGRFLETGYQKLYITPPVTPFDFNR